MQESRQELIEKIAQGSGKSQSEVKELVEKKKEKFTGLLTEDGAAFMVAKELGIELGEASPVKGKISKLEDGQQNLDLLVRVMHVFSPKQFEKNGKKGKLCSLIVADDTGETRLTLWHRDVEKMRETGVEKGSVLLLRNCYVKTFNEKPQLNLSYNGSMAVNPKGADWSCLPKAERKECSLSELRPDMVDISAVARVLRLFPATDFEKQDRKGKVMNFLIADETATIRATAWNDLVEAAEKLHENDLIKVEGAYTKGGMQGIELHLGWRSRIIQNPKLGKELPSAMQLLNEKTETRKVRELNPELGIVAVQGAIVVVNPGQLRYSVCGTCGGKIQRLDQGVVCGKCGEVKEQDIRAVVSVRIDDGSAQINAVAYGETAEKLLGFGKQELQERLGKMQAEEIIGELQERLAGKKIKAIGRARENAYSNEMQFAVRNFEFG